MRDLQSGSFDEGGSTITQQLAKNMFLSSDKTLTRKIKELGYAIKIHFAYSKDEILELYLNSIYFGEGQWGVEGAAQHYFGKPVNKVTLAEAALLAGLPKAPSRYSPVKHPEEALTRRNLVLSLMKEQQLIEAADYGQAVAEPIRLKAESGESLKGKFPAFVDYVMDEAETKYGFTEQQLLTMGLRIHTTMDLTVQQSAEAVFARQELLPASPDQKLVQAAAVVLEPASGAVRAVIGGRGEQTYRASTAPPSSSASRARRSSRWPCTDPRWNTAIRPTPCSLTASSISAATGRGTGTDKPAEKCPCAKPSPARGTFPPSGC